MQSMFRLPWSSEPPGDKIMEKSAFHKPRHVPVVEIPLLNKLKRKRTDSPEPSNPHNAHIVKKWKCARGEVKPAVIDVGDSGRPHIVDGIAPEVSEPVKAQEDTGAPTLEGKSSLPTTGETLKEDIIRTKFTESPHPSSTSPDTAPIDKNTVAMGTPLSQLQQAIEAQFNYEVLLKHNELRLIEQELGKCQVALEQLRRCQLIPYPGTESFSENVSNGVGPALKPRGGFTQPTHPAPWGVTDGPYTRHYAKWLIPDPKFDSVPQQSGFGHGQSYSGAGEGRTTRGSFAEYPTAGKSRSSRTSAGTLKFQALGENPAPVQKQDPLLHKRSTDGQWVRLYCAACKHSNFSNTQGFLNHCRIKHNQVFKSHDAAAIACGVPVDTNELGSTLPPNDSTPANAATPTVGLSGSSTPGFVHPLIRSNATGPAKNVPPRPIPAPTPQLKTLGLSTSVIPAAPVPEAISPGISKVPFISSPQTPYMNALLQKRGFSGNYKQIVETARTPIDLDSLETSDDEERDSTVQTPVHRDSKAATSQQLARLPASAATNGKTPVRPSSKKGRLDPVRLPRTALHPPSVSVNGIASNGDRNVPESPVDLSPNTVESNPGLMSDHDDDDDEDDADARSVPQLDRDGDFVLDDDVIVEYASDVEGEGDRRKGMVGFEKAGPSRKR